MQISNCHEKQKRGLEFLVVDDDHTIRKIMRLQLKPFGLKVDVAEDGAQAVQHARNFRYDVIFMDIQMPKMNGIVATTAIRNLEVEHGYAPAHIIATTGGGATREQCLDAGMNDYLQKPVGFDKLVEILYHLLAARQLRVAESNLPECECCT
ncbi:MAG TPA: response regulator [Drouetiella sp.]